MTDTQDDTFVDEMSQEIDNGEGRKKTVRQDKDDGNYVSNKELIAAATEYHNSWQAWKESDYTIPRPVMSDALALMIKKIASRTVYNAKFIKFPAIREEMVSGAIVNCLAYGHNFNPNAETRSGQVNAFGYFTQICTNAYIQRIKLEKSQYLIKAKYVQSIEMADQIDQVFEQCDDDNSYGVASQIRHFYNVNLPDPKRKPREGDPDYIPPEPKGLENFFEV
jgi:hypothetical protein